MKRRLMGRYTALMTLVLTAASLLGSVDRGGCQIPVSRGTLVFSRVNPQLHGAQIYSMSSNGKNLKPLTSAQANTGMWDPSWSPDGSRIVYVVKTQLASALTVMPADGSQQTILVTSNEDINRPVWSPDGRWIAFGKGRGIYLLDMNARRRVPVLLYNGGSAGTACRPSWRRDSWRLAFTYQDLHQWSSDIYTINVDGSGLTNLTNTPYISEGCPAWSPDGNSIAYVQGRLLDEFATMLGEIYLIGADGSNSRPVTYTGGMCLGAPAWSPDGEMLAYSAQDNYGYDCLFATIPDNGSTVQLTFGNYDCYPAWKR